MKEQERTDRWETFDISGKIDTSNPIYRFYDKEIQKFLQKFGGKKVTDAKGVTWVEVPIKTAMKNDPVLAFGKTTVGTMIAGGTISLGLASILYAMDQPEEENYQTETPDETVEPLDSEGEKWVQSVAHNESRGVDGDKYSFKKFSGREDMGSDLGKYQITSAKLKENAKRFLGRDVTEEEFLNTPGLQERFIREEYKFLKSKGFTDPGSMLAAHRGGWSDLNREATTKRNKKYSAVS